MSAPATRRPRTAARAAASAGPGLELWGAGFAVAAAALAAAAAWPIYASPRFLLVAVVGTVLALGIGAVSARLRWGVPATAGVAALVFALAVVPLAVPSALASPARMLLGVRDGLFGVVLGWKQLLTLALPLGEYQAVLVPWLVVVFWGGLLIALLVLRGGRAAPAAVPVAAAMVAFGLGFGASTTSAPVVLGGLLVSAPRELALGAGLVLVSLVWLLGRGRILRARAIRQASGRAATMRRSGGSAWIAVRRNLTAVALVVAAAAGGLAIAPTAAALGERSALRDEVEPSVIVRREPSPLAGYRAAFAGEAFDETLFTVSGDLDEIGRVRIATLDDYDGETFHVGERASEPGSFRRLPRAGGDGARFGLEVGPGFDGIWVPVPDGLDSAPAFTGPNADALADGFFVDADGSTAIETASADGIAGLVPGDGYRVRVAPASAAGGLAGATGGESGIDEAEHPALVAWAEAQDQPRTGDGLVELVARLRARGFASHSLDDDAGAQAWLAALGADGAAGFRSSAAGHSTARIERVFTDLTAQEQRAGADAEPAFLVSAAGDDEQFAVAAALLARYQGFDSRVVLGVRVGTPEDDTLPACADVCTGGDLAAWVEVAGPTGWVALDATPQHALQPIDISQGEVLPEHATVPSEVAPELIDPEQVPSDDQRAPSETTVDEPDTVLADVLPVVRIVLLSLGGAACLIAPFATLLVAKALRRRGRRAAPPEPAIVGAWEELLDRYADFGVPFDGAATRASASAASGRPAAVALAAAVDHAVFSEHPPPAELAEWAWQTVDAELAELRAERTLRERLGAALGLAGFRRALAPDASPKSRPARPRKEPA